MSTSGEPEHGDARVAEAERIEQLAEEFYEVDRLQRRLDGVRERLRAYEEEQEALNEALGRRQRALRRAQRGVLSLWLRVRGTREQRIRDEQRALDRIEQRRDARSRLLGTLERQRASLRVELGAYRPVSKLRLALDAALERQRAYLERGAPELAAQVRALEDALPQARAERAAAERALSTVREIRFLLDASRRHLDTAVGRSRLDAFVEWLPVTIWKYRAVNRATANLKAARALMDELRALDAVRDELEPLEPSIRMPLRVADYVLSSFLVDYSVLARIEDSLDGVVEAQKLFADLEPALERAAQHARHHAENLERRWRAALLAVTAFPSDSR